MDGSDRILSLLYIKETLLYPTHTIFVLENQYPKILKILSRKYPNLNFSKKGLGKIKLYVTLFRLVFHCVKMNWKLLLKIMKNSFK